MTPEEIRGFVTVVLADETNELKKVEIGRIVEATDDTGNKYDGWAVILDNSGVRHVFKNHSNETTERNRGLIAINTEDFVLLGERIPPITRFTHEGRAGIGMEVILDKHLSQTIYYYFLFEIRPKWNELFLKTMYKANH